MSDYRRITIGFGQRVYLHRLVWERQHGPIPEGMEIHHDCEDKSCDDVTHMRLLTKSEHAKLHHERKTTCRKGLHPWVEENILRMPSGNRCRECLRETRRRTEQTPARRAYRQLQRQRRAEASH